MLLLRAGLCALVLSSLPVMAAVSGEAVYAKRCAVCHEQVNDHIPSHESLKKLPAGRIMRAMDFGVMMSIAYPMSREDREAVAKYIGTPAADTPPPAAGFCSDRKVTVNDKAKYIWNGWSPSGDNTRFAPANLAGLTVDQAKHLKLKWAYGFEGDTTAFAPPAYFDGQLFLGSAGGMIQALKADTGCMQWYYQASGPVRSAIQVVPNGSGHALLFGDQTGWFYSLEAETGKLNWRKKVEDHDTARLTGAAMVHGDVVYVPVASWEESRNGAQDYPCCSFRGSLVALKIKDGSQVWKSYMITDTPIERGKTASGLTKFGPSGASIWSAPTFDSKRNLIYVMTGDNFSSPATLTSDALVALDPATGKIAWSKQVTEGDVSPGEKGPDFDFGSSGLLVKGPDGKDIVLAGQKSGIVYAFDPDKKGDLIWQTRVGKGSAQGGVQWGMAADGQNVYAATSDAAGTRGRTPEGASVRVFDKTKGGGITALKIADGSKVWYTPAGTCTTEGCSPAQSGAVTGIPGLVFSGSLDGHIRAYAAEDGKVVWDFDTVKEFKTVNGVKAHGGALDGAGPVIVNGMVFVNSGYPRFGGLPGNVLLAFTADGN